MTKLKVVFIVGCQRTGTTMVGNILGSHPNAYLIDEPNGVYKWLEATFSDQDGNVTNTLFKQCCLEARNNYQDPNSKCNEDGVISESISHLILKTPNLTYCAEDIAKYFPKANCIFTYRDIRDVVVSMSKLNWLSMVQNQLKLMQKYPKILSKYESEIIALNQADIKPHQARAYIAKIKTGLRDTFNRPDIQKIELQYEDITQHPEESSKKLLESLNLITEKQQSSHIDSMKGWGPGLNYRRSKINTLSIGQWQQFLTNDQENDIWKIIQPMMKELGYQRSIDKTALSKSWNRVESSLKYQPIIATGRGGSGTRLLSELLQHLNVFLGNQLNKPGDSIEWVALLYKLGVERTRQKSSSPMPYWQHPLQETAADILIEGAWDGQQAWGWKLPESMLALPEIFETFHQGKLIHLIRHPIDTCLRRSHMTSRRDNQIGKAVLKAAYKQLGWKQSRIISDPDYLRNAASWLYQVGEVSRFGRIQLGSERYLELRYEDICTNTIEAVKSLANFLNIKIPNHFPELEIDLQRCRKWSFPDPRTEEVWNICGELALELGYQPIIE